MKYVVNYFKYFRKLVVIKKDVLYQRKNYPMEFKKKSSISPKTTRCYPTPPPNRGV